MAGTASVAFPSSCSRVELDVSALTVESQESDETIEDVQLYSRPALIDLVATGRIVDATTLASLSLYWANTASKL